MRELIDRAFPHRDARGRPSYRRHQFETIRDVLSAIDDGVQDIVVEAPTGAGKTSVAVTVARVVTNGFADVKRRARHMPLDEALGLMTPHQAHLVTSMKMLQDAYLGDDDQIALVKGKSNYHCDRPVDGFPDLTCEDADQIFGHMCGDRCPYLISRNRALWSAMALHNFDSFLYQATLGQVFLPRRLLTIDEAHNVEEKVRSFMTMVLDERLFRSLGLKWRRLPGDLDDMAAVSDWCLQFLEEIKEKSSVLRQNLARARDQGVRGIVEAARSARILRRAESVATRVSRFIDSLNPPTGIRPAVWVAYDDEGALVLEPVEARRFVPSALLRFGEHRLHLSATFLDGGGSYRRSVHLPMNGVRHVTVPSTFGAERRALILSDEVGSLSHADWGRNFPAAIRVLRRLIDENPGVRGVVHCTSYDMSRQIERALNHRRLIGYGREDREAVVGDFVGGRSRADAVLLAVAMSEGYDLKDDLCRFQVIIRLPFAYPSKNVQARRAIDPRHYGWRACLTLVQSYGRGMRSSQDFCRTYVLDGRARRFVERERDQLPGWFLEAIQ